MRIKPKKIMCAIDFSEFTNLILSYGRSLALEFGSKLCVCHIVARTIMVSSHMPPYIDHAGIESERVKSVRDKIEDMVKALGIECEIIVCVGSAADEIEQIVSENEVDMLIAATHGGSGVKRFLIGSVTNRLVKTLSCPLLVLHAQEDDLVSKEMDPIKLKRILVGCDFSEDSKLAFDYALSLAQEFQTQLYLIHVTSPMEEIQLASADYIKIQEGEHVGWTKSQEQDLEKKASDEDWQKKTALLSSLEKRLLNMVPEDSRNWCTPMTVVLEGQPYREVLDYAKKEEMDLIVLGVRGHSLLERFLVGSTTDRVISRASCPVLAVRHIV